MAVARALRAPLRQAWRSLASDRRLCSGPEKGVRPWSTLLEEVNGPAARGDVAGARDAFYRILAEQKPALKVQRNLANCVLKAYAIAADAEGAWAWAKTMHEMHLPLSAWSVGKLFGAAARSKSSATEEWLRQSQDLRLPLDGTATRTICAACAHATADQQRALSWLQRAQREVAMDERPEAQGASPEAENQVVSYTTLAKAAAKLGDLAQVHFWIQQIEAAGLAPDVVSFNIVIDAYAQQGRHHEASRWFGKMLEHGIPPNEVAFTTMITACARRGDAEEAEEWLLEMWRVALAPGEATYNALLNAFAKGGNSAAAQAWVQCMMENQVRPSEISYTAVIDACARSGDTEGAVSWLQRMTSAVGPSLFALNAALGAFARAGDFKKAQELLQSCPAPNIVSYNTVIKSHAKGGDAAGAAEWLEKMQEYQVVPNLISYNTVIAAYAQQGDPDSVADILERMTAAQLEPSVITWTSMLNACATAKPRRAKAAERVFRQMLVSGCQPNKVTLQALGRSMGFPKSRALLVELNMKDPGDS